MKVNFKDIFQKTKSLVMSTVDGFSNDKGTKLSAALAYNAVFALPPMLLLIIIAGGTFLGQQAIEGELFGHLRDFLGDDLAIQIQDIMKKIDFNSNSRLATIISFVTLFMGATGMFIEIQDSLNIIWGVKARAKKGIIKVVLNRFISFALIVGLGILLLATLLLNIVLTTFNNVILEYFPFIPINTIDWVNTGITFIVLTFLFIIVFKFLPDVKLKWKEVLPGAIVTALLFLLGKFLIGLYLTGSSKASLYGAAGSIILLLLWINYSAIILYFGAEFTKAYIEMKGVDVKPNSFAEFTDKQIVSQMNKIDANKDGIPDYKQIE